MVELPPLPPRLLHLPGGLRLLDERTDTIVLQLHARRTFATLTSPEYSRVYAAVSDIGLPTIGAEFLILSSLQGIAAPDWQLAAPSGGFALRMERNAWSDVRTLAQRERRPVHADLASRAVTYLELVAIRVLDISSSYSRALIAFDDGNDATQKIGHLFRNGHSRALDAAVHAFVADAASFRDLIVEAAWSLLTLGDHEVRQIERFLNHYQVGTHPIGDELSDVAGSGGWLAQLSALRNDITHAAPIGGRGLRECAVRGHSLGADVLPRLHYPLFGADGRLFDETLDPDFGDNARARATLDRYRTWSDASTDALEYAWRSTDRLVELLARVRVASGLRGERLTISDDDIIGPVAFAHG